MVASRSVILISCQVHVNVNENENSVAFFCVAQSVFCIRCDIR